MGARTVDQETIQRWISEAIADNPGGSSYLVYMGGVQDNGGFAEIPILNQLGGSFVQAGTGDYVLATTTAWPGDYKVFCPLRMYPYGTPVCNTSGVITGFWAIDVYDDDVVTVELFIKATSGNAVDLDVVFGNAVFQLPQIVVLTT